MKIGTIGAPLMRSYLVLSGLVVAPVLGALLLAQGMGLLPPLQKVRALFERQTSSGRAAEVAQEVVEVPSDAELWHSRLLQMQAQVDEDSREARGQFEAVDELRKQVAEMESVTARVIGVLLEETVAPGELLTRRDELEGKLLALRSEAERLPELLKSLEAVDPKSLAVILVGSEGQPGLPDDDSVRVLEGLPSRKTAKVLEAMARVNAAAATRLLERMGSPAAGG